ncbi:hypothetical protein BHM03_00052933 [Ensete ventricosum]|nr:hypothetical protein BHM03_00052933 [Ensete ventricosum]
MQVWHGGRELLRLAKMTAHETTNSSEKLRTLREVTGKSFLATKDELSSPCETSLPVSFPGDTHRKLHRPPFIGDKAGQDLSSYDQEDGFGREEEPQA